MIQQNSALLTNHTWNAMLRKKDNNNIGKVLQLTTITGQDMCC